MLQPKRVKYRKVHRGRLKGRAHSGDTIVFGDFALRAEESAWVTARQIEAARRVLVRYLRRGGRLWIRIFPDKVVTKKPAETRMGGGKGAPDHWVAVVKRGRIMFELEGISESTAREAVHLACDKLPITASFAVREGKVES
ncbi:MAG: 50S ribosomal protein L16 [Chloroflexi bacterium CG07_land_8_20_14_0_80_45_17]|nr:MAG: 50S ribosomal protein L16 [Chloroflexi bacterium CG07_land_8_20_14_0_80_45_17]